MHEMRMKTRGLLGELGYSAACSCGWTDVFWWNGETFPAEAWRWHVVDALLAFHGYDFDAEALR